MRVTVIPEDRMIAVDGVGLVCDFEPHIAGLHAIQWYGDHGEAEIVENGEFINRAVTENDVRPYINLWATQKAVNEGAENQPPTPEEIQARYVALAQRYMDGVAQTRGYDSIFTAIGYENSEVPKFQREAVACKRLRDAVWVFGFDLLDRVMAGEAEIPTPDEFVAMLPRMDWGDA